MASVIPGASAGRRCAEPDYATLEAAASWYATLHSDEAGAADRQAWQAWLEQSEAHARAWSYIETVSQRFDPLRTGGHQAALAGVKAARRGSAGRRQVLRGLAGVFGLGMAGWMGWRHSALPETLLAWGADYRTATGEQREITLADGSRVWLNTDSALRVDYQAGARRLTLAAGEILVETGQDASQRPFYVDTRFGRMQALGTRFSVRHDARRTRLDVFASAVEINNAAGKVQRVEAGESAEFTADGIAALGQAERAREAWRRGVVVADNIPLGALIEDLARYQRGHLGVAPEVAELSVVGVYPATDTERALAMLENTLPIRVKRRTSWWVTLEAR
ncbi:MAG TPA: FecR domain-containing protein [Azonexus sp.]